MIVVCLLLYIDRYATRTLKLQGYGIKTSIPRVLAQVKNS